MIAAIGALIPKRSKGCLIGRYNACGAIAPRQLFGEA
jgi:hypothetical protein